MSGSEEHQEDVKMVFDLFVETIEKLGYNHPLPPKLFDFFLGELGVEINVDAEIRRILGPYAVEFRGKGSKDDHTSEISPPARRPCQQTSPAPQMFNDVMKIPPGPFKGTFASYLGSFVPIRALKENLDSQPEGSQRYLLQVCSRATRLASLAHKNLRYAVSEYTWEADLRDELFRLMRDDPRISM
jgi:hypothetical protein